MYPHLGVLDVLFHKSDREHLFALGRLAARRGDYAAVQERVELFKHGRLGRARLLLVAADVEVLDEVLHGGGACVAGAHHKLPELYSPRRSPDPPSSTPGWRYRCMRRTCSEMALSRCSSVSSVTTNSRSKRESSESGSAILRCGSLCTSYWRDDARQNQCMRPPWSAPGPHLPVDWGRSCHHTAPRIERRMDARLGNRHRLLLHDLVDGDAIDVGHFIKLVDTHDAAVGEDHGARLEAALARVLVGRDGRGETDAGRSAAGGGDRERRRVEHEAEHLRLCRGGVADHENVDVSANVRPVGEVFLLAAEEEQQDRRLDVVGAVDGRRERLREEVENVAPLGELVD